MGLFSRRREQRAATLTLEQLLADTGVPTSSGEPVTTDSAMRLSACWACIRLLADSVSSLPVDCYRGDELVATPPLLREPSDGLEAHDFVHAVMVSLLTHGNAYALVTARSGPGLLPAQVELVNPDRVSVRVDPETGRVVYSVAGNDVDRSDVWHVKGFTVPGQVLGLSPIGYARQSVGLGLAAERFGAEFFGAHGVPVGQVVPADGAVWQSGDDEHDDTAKHFAEMWRRYYHARRRPGVFVLNGARFESISVQPDESQFLETQKFTVAQIARVFGVPSELVGETSGSMTYSNIESRMLHYLVLSLTPWILRVERGLSRLLPSTLSVKLNADALLRSTTKERYEAHQIALQAGFMTVDEVRELEDLPPMPSSQAPPAATDTSGNGQRDNIGALS